MLLFFFPFSVSCCMLRSEQHLNIKIISKYLKQFKMKIGALKKRHYFIVI